MRGRWKERGTEKDGGCMKRSATRITDICDEMLMWWSADRRESVWSLLPRCRHQIQTHITLLLLYTLWRSIKPSPPFYFSQSHISPLSLLYSSNMISSFGKLSSSSTYRTVGVKRASPARSSWNQLHISPSNTDHRAYVPKGWGGYIGCEKWLPQKKNRLKYKMSRCCFNTLPPLLPSLPAWSCSRQSIPPCQPRRQAAATLLLWHPSLLILVSPLHPTSLAPHPLVLSFSLSMYLFSLSLYLTPLHCACSAVWCLVC